VTWQPGEAPDGEESAAGLAIAAAGQPGTADPAPAGESPDPGDGYPQYGRKLRRGLTWAAMFALLAVGLGGLAGAAGGAVRQLLPREFSPAQQQQIRTWEMTRRWRALPAGQIFPAQPTYKVQGPVLDSSGALKLTARRLGIAPQSGCARAVSPAAAAILTAGHCAVLLRATYLDASGSMVVTVGIAAMPTASAATASADRLNGQAILHTFPLARSAAARFRQRQRQLSIAVANGNGPYLVLATAGFVDGRRHVPLATDDYLQQEMNSFATGLANSLASRLAARVSAAVCPGAPGC